MDGWRGSIGPGLHTNMRIAGCKSELEDGRKDAGLGIEFERFERIWIPCDSDSFKDQQKVSFPEVSYHIEFCLQVIDFGKVPPNFLCSLIDGGFFFQLADRASI